MYFSKKLLILIVALSAFFLLTSPILAAAPDGIGPWADSVLSAHQGVMKNGLAVPAIRSDPTAALGVAENTIADGTFFSLGFNGDIALGFDNGISSGAMVIESTNPNYPIETAKVEMSEDGVNWVMAGNVNQSGTVGIPETISCAKYVRITNTSIAVNYPDDIADGYDVDGVMATGDPCTPATPTPLPTSTPTPTDVPTPTLSPTNPPTSSVTSSNNNNNNNVPGFPNTGGAPTCTSAGVTTIPQITDAHRISPTSISVSWGPNAGLSDFIVRYGFSQGNWQFNTKVNGFSTTINSLPANVGIWIQVAATDNCVDGAYGTAVFVGGNATTNTPGFPNTGNPLVPGFPNTGIGPTNESFFSGIVTHIWNWIKAGFGSNQFSFFQYFL